MKERLKELLKNSYNPYSHVAVSCIVVMNDGNSFAGVNVENASFREGLCAEQVAISQAIANGYKDGDFKEIHVMGTTDEPIKPCFLCRQLLSEVFLKDSKVFCYNDKFNQEVYELSELCTHAFGMEDIKGELNDAR